MVVSSFGHLRTIRVSAPPAGDIQSRNRLVIPSINTVLPDENSRYLLDLIYYMI